MNEKDKLMEWLQEHKETKPIRLVELMSNRLLEAADSIDQLEAQIRTKMMVDIYDLFIDAVSSQPLN